MRLSEIEQSSEITLIINSKDVTLSKQITIAENQPLKETVLFNIEKQNGKIIGFKSSENTTINIQFTQDQTAWEAENITIDTILYKGVPYYRVLDVDAKKINRREAYREFISTNMFLNATIDRPDFIKVEVRDISETGFAFYTKENIPIGAKVLLKFRYYRISDSLFAVVVRKVEEPGRVLYGCRLSDKQKSLGKFMVNVQREKRFNMK